MHQDIFELKKKKRNKLELKYIQEAGNAELENRTWKGEGHWVLAVARVGAGMAWLRS